MNTGVNLPSILFIIVKIRIMKKYFVLFLAAAALLQSCGGDQATDNVTPAHNPVTDPAKAAKMEFAAMEHDFGTINQGDSAVHVFQFTNTSSNPLIISAAKGSCGCTVPQYPKEPIQPGSTGEIKVKFNSAGKKGQNTKTVTLTANTIPAETILKIHADVLVPAN